MSINKIFLIAVYHDQLDDVIALSSEGKIDPALACVDGLDALSVSVLSPFASPSTTLWLLANGCDAFKVSPIGVSAAMLVCCDAKTSDMIVETVVRAANTPLKQIHLVDCAARWQRCDILMRLADGEKTIGSPVRRRIANATFAMDIDRWNETWIESILDEVGDADRSTSHVAAFVGNRQPFESARCVVNRRDSLQRTPLMYAIDGRQDVDFVEFLIHLGADVNAKGAHGSVLQHACRIGRHSIVEALLRTPGIRVDDFALHTAFGFGVELRTVEALCAAGGDLNVRCRPHGWLPVHYLADSMTRDAVRQPGRATEMLASRMKLMTFALDAHENDGDDEVRCSSGQTLLMLACAHSNAPLARMILRRAKDPAKLTALVDSRGRTAYHWACHRNATEALEVLKEFDVIRVVREIVDNDGQSGEALLAASIDTPRKHRSWPDPIERGDVLGTRERDTDADIASAIGAASALCARHFDLAQLPRKPKTCAGCFRLTTSPKRCARCKSEIYCSSACQRLSWPTHRALCVDAFPTLRETLLSTPSVEPR